MRAALNEEAIPEISALESFFFSIFRSRRSLLLLINHTDILIY